MIVHFYAPLADQARLESLLHGGADLQPDGRVPSAMLGEAGQSADLALLHSPPGENAYLALDVLWVPGCSRIARLWQVEYSLGCLRHSTVRVHLRDYELPVHEGDDVFPEGVQTSFERMVNHVWVT